MKHLTLRNDRPGTPWRGLFDLGRDFESMFDTIGRAEERDLFHPASDVAETDSHYVMSVDLPGVSKKDINIEVANNELVISGERRSEKQERGFSERMYGKFHRVFTLPSDVNAENVEANYENGVLTIALAKAETAKTRQIKIGEGKGTFFNKLQEKISGERAA